MQQAIDSDRSDEDLAILARNDSSAFGGLYDRHFDGVYAYLRYRLDDRATADDLVAAVFTRALDRLGTYDPARAPFKVWLLTIARNLLRDHFRSRARWRWLPLDAVRSRPANEEPADVGLEVEERRAAVLAAVARLGDRDRDVLGLKFGGGHTNRDIAAITGLSESNVGVIIYRALGRLREDLNQEEGRHV